MRRALVTVVVVLMIGVAAGCSGDTVDTKADTAADDTTTTTEATATTAAVGPGEAAEAYFAALASATPADDQDAIDSSKEGSVARDYAVVLNAVHAGQAAGGLLEEATIEVNGDEIRRCRTQSADCTVYADIEVDGNKVTDFTIDGEDPSGRVVAGGTPVTVAGVTYTPIGAYLSITSDDQLLIPYEVTNSTTSTLQIETFGEAYVDSSGRQFSATDSSGPTSPLQPGATATVVALFEGATPGGQLAVNGFLNDSNYTEAPATLAIPGIAA